MAAAAGGAPTGVAGDVSETMGNVSEKIGDTVGAVSDELIGAGKGFWSAVRRFFSGK